MLIVEEGGPNSDPRGYIRSLARIQPELAVGVATYGAHGSVCHKHNHVCLAHADVNNVQFCVVPPLNALQDYHNGNWIAREPFEYRLPPRIPTPGVEVVAARQCSQDVAASRNLDDGTRREVFEAGDPTRSVCWAVAPVSTKGRNKTRTQSAVGKICSVPAAALTSHLSRPDRGTRETGHRPKSRPGPWT